MRDTGRQRHLSPAYVDHMQAFTGAAKRHVLSASSTDGVTDLSATLSGLTVALASPLPHHRAAVSIAAKAPPSLAPLALAMIRDMT